MHAPCAGSQHVCRGQRLENRLQCPVSIGCQNHVSANAPAVVGSRSGPPAFVEGKQYASSK